MQSFIFDHDIFNSFYLKKIYFHTLLTRFLASSEEGLVYLGLVYLKSGFRLVGVGFKLVNFSRVNNNASRNWNFMTEQSFQG